MSEAKKRLSHLRLYRHSVSKTLFITALLVLAGSFSGLRAQAQTITEVAPGVSAPDGIVKLTFSADVKPASVKIGNVDASFVAPPSPTKTLELKVPTNAPLGPQTISVAAAGITQPITASITIAATIPTTVSVKPAVTQPGGIVWLIFNKQVTVTSVKIGNVDGSFIPVPTYQLQVTLPTNAALGQQTISVTIANTNEPLVSEITVAPLILGLRARKDAELELNRVVVAGGEVIVQFADNIPSGIKQNLNVRLIDTTTPQAANSAAGQAAKICSQGQPLSFRVPEDNYLIVTAPDDGASGTTYAVRVCAGDAPLERETRIRVRNVSYLYLRASIIVALLILLLYGFYSLGRWVKRKLSQGQKEKGYSFLSMLLLEPENQTYSLSRAQFLGWLFVIVWCYLFLYYAHGYVEGRWGFPNFGNSIYAFLISLGTLVAAQATNKGMGVKGAGEEHPSVADLVVHGGVLALDRVQQVIWTLIALGMFVRITVSTFATADALPSIPSEMLTLMGLSSAGYLGGKLVRGPGPVIQQVTPGEGATFALNIKGKHLSKDAFVWLDGKQLAKEKVTVKVADPDDPANFATELVATLDTSMADWIATDHAITVVNNDAQRADWRTTPTIVNVTPGPPSDGKVSLTITGAHIAKGATIEVKDTNQAASQDAANPNLFTATVPEAWVKSDHDLVLTSGTQTSTFKYKPATAGGGDQGGGDQPGGEQPGGEQAGGEQPGGEQAGGEQAGGEQPGGEQAGG
jgi:hypothetical protein